MGQVDFFGEPLEVFASVSDFARAELAEANLSISEDDPYSMMRANAALLALVEDCVTPADRGKFRKLARENRASFDDLYGLLGRVAEQETGRPTGGSADSSDGPSVTPLNSESNAEGRVADLFPGRPDKQLAVLRSRSA